MDTLRRPERIGLYPSIEPYRTGMLDVGDGHTLYYEECGRADGVPIIALHGGPGGGAAPSMRRFFDPDIYRIIVFDQRGCGRSRPFSDTRANTTQKLVGDMETIRSSLGIDRWIVFGGSWGATLALAYARACPAEVMGLVLRGVFGCTKAELDWFYRNGANQIFPDAWHALTARLTDDERANVLNAYHARLQTDCCEARRSDALAWAQWENALISLLQTVTGLRLTRIAPTRWRGWRRTISSITAFSNMTASSSRTPLIWPAFRALSFRAGTIW